jgi:hypothetical protein
MTVLEWRPLTAYDSVARETTDSSGKRCYGYTGSSGALLWTPLTAQGSVAMDTNDSSGHGLLLYGRRETYNIKQNEQAMENILLSKTYMRLN